MCGACAQLEFDFFPFLFFCYLEAAVGIPSPVLLDRIRLLLHNKGLSESNVNCTCRLFRYILACDILSAWNPFRCNLLPVLFFDYAQINTLLRYGTLLGLLRYHYIKSLQVYLPYSWKKMRTKRNDANNKKLDLANGALRGRSLFPLDSLSTHTRTHAEKRGFPSGNCFEEGFIWH